MRIRIAGAIACFALAAVFSLAAMRVIARGPDLATPDGYGQAVGAFLPAFGMLILGLWLWQKKPRKPE